MYCKMLGICRSAMLKKQNVWKSLVERNRSAQPLHSSIFSIQLELTVGLSTQYNFTYSTSTVYRYVRVNLRVYTGGPLRTRVLASTVAAAASYR